MTIEEFINYFEEESKEHTNLVPYDMDEKYNKNCKQLAGWLRELKVYKDLSTYNRENKCCECEYEDSEYFCDDCIWNFVNKFKQKEINADGEESDKE